MNEITKDVRSKVSCSACANLVRETESWEMPHIWWWACHSPSAGKANLKSFPFSSTQCKDFCEKRKPISPAAEVRHE